MAQDAYVDVYTRKEHECEVKDLFTETTLDLIPYRPATCGDLDRAEEDEATGGNQIHLFACFALLGEEEDLLHDVDCYTEVLRRLVESFPDTCASLSTDWGPVAFVIQNDVQRNRLRDGHDGEPLNTVTVASSQRTTAEPSNAQSDPLVDAPAASLVGKQSGDSPATPATTTKRVGRNRECPCGSRKKYKNCCSRRDADAAYWSANRQLFARLEEERIRAEAILRCLTAIRQLEITLARKFEAAAASGDRWEPGQIMDEANKLGRAIDCMRREIEFYLERERLSGNSYLRKMTDGFPQRFFELSRLLPKEPAK